MKKACRGMTWDEYFLTMAATAALKSKDRSTKVGAIIVGPDHEVISTGFNGFPRGIDDNLEKRHARPAKYSWTVHAEKNSIYNAAMHGSATRGCTMYITGLPPCASCARAIIQAGIVAVVVHENKISDHYKEECLFAADMLKEAGITLKSI